MAKKKRKLSAYNRHVQREMKAGKSMKAAARSWKGGKRSTKRSPKRSPTKRRAPVRRAKTGGRKVAKGGFNTQKLFKLVRMAALAAPAAAIALAPAASMENKIKTIIGQYTGYDFFQGKFRPDLLVGGYAPYVGAVLATYGIPKLTGILRGI